jgi:hypothetical protein
MQRLRLEFDPAAVNSGAQSVQRRHDGARQRGFCGSVPAIGGLRRPNGLPWSVRAFSSSGLEVAGPANRLIVACLRYDSQHVSQEFSRWVYRQFSQEVCRYNIKFAQELKEQAFAPREVIAGKRCADSRA